MANVTVLPTTTIDNYNYPEPVSVIYIVMSTMIICENILGVVVIWLNPNLPTASYAFVGSMAFTDIAYGVCFLLANTIRLLDSRDLFPDTDFTVYFTVTTSLVYTFTTTSVLHMAMIALERYLYIAHLFFYRRTCTTPTFCIVLCFFWTVSVALPVAFFAVTGGQSFMQDKNPPDRIASALFVLGVVITGFAYCLIVKVAKKRNFAKNKRKHITQRDESWKHTIKTIRFFAITYGIFLFLSLPVIGNTIARYVQVDIPWTAVYLSTSMSVLVCAVNFFVLIATNAEFRQSCKKTLTLAPCCRR